MKKLLLMILALLLAVPALAEPAGVSLPPFALTAPEETAAEQGENSVTFVRGRTRVVAMVILRVPDGEPNEALTRLMGQYDPAAVIGETLVMNEGYAGLTAVSADKLSPGVDQVTAMVLSGGDLLILSGYDLDGDEALVRQLITDLLAAARCGDSPLMPAPAAAPIPD